MKRVYFCLFCSIWFILLTACQGKEKAVSDTEEVTGNPVVTITEMSAESEVTAPVDGPTITPNPSPNPEAQEKKEASGFTIVIDAGHQKHHNADQEPIGPGAKVTKDKVSSGTQGRYTGVPEYQVNLDVSLKLKDILSGQGYRVIMIRETNDVDISNKERADIANKNKADVFVRIHCNGAEDSSINGILTLCPTKKNPYCKDIYKESRALSRNILNSLCDLTGAKNKGVTETDLMSGINWSKVPVTIIEMGYMTNKKEDYKLSEDKYQDLLAQGIAEGIQKYLN